MTKLCPRGKAAAKRKFKVYPSAYANAYASKICAGKIKDPSGVKRKDFRGPKPAKAMGGRIRKMGGGMMQMPRAMYKKGGKALKPVDKEKNPGLAKLPTKVRNKMGFMKKGGSVKKFPDLSGDGKVTMKDILMGRGVIPRKGKKGGGLMEATSRLKAQGLKAGGVAKGCGAVMNDRRKVTKMY
jgi:hypothetical protein